MPHSKPKNVPLNDFLAKITTEGLRICWTLQDVAKLQLSNNRNTRNHWSTAGLWRYASEQRRDFTQTTQTNRETPTMTGIRTACKCLLGLWIGCSMLSSASAQMMMNHGGSHVGGLNMGQHRIVGFQPINGMSGISTSSLYGSGVTFGQPMGGFSGLNSGSVVGFRPAGSYSQFGSYGGGMNLGGLNSGVVTTGSQYGRIIRYRYRVPVYGRVNSCGTPASSCNSCGP